MLQYLTTDVWLNCLMPCHVPERQVLILEVVVAEVNRAEKPDLERNIVLNRCWILTSWSKTYRHPIVKWTWPEISMLQSGFCGCKSLQDGITFHNSSKLVYSPNRDVKKVNHRNISRKMLPTGMLLANCHFSNKRFLDILLRLYLQRMLWRRH